MEQKRGQLTDRIKEKSRELFSCEFTQEELRLLPYIQYLMVNEQRIEPTSVSVDEQIILDKWREIGYIKDGSGGLSITKEFWNKICELIFLGYVDLNN